MSCCSPRGTSTNATTADRHRRVPEFAVRNRMVATAATSSSAVACTHTMDWIGGHDVYGSALTVDGAQTAPARESVPAPALGLGQIERGEWGQVRAGERRQDPGEGAPHGLRSCLVAIRQTIDRPRGNRPAKPCTPVRFRLPPPIASRAWRTVDPRVGRENRLGWARATSSGWQMPLDTARARR